MRFVCLAARVAVGLLLLMPFGVSISAQEASPPEPATPTTESFRVHAALTPLFPIAGDDRADMPASFRSGRITVGWQRHPGLGVHLGVMRLLLAPPGNRMLGALAGARYSVTLGPVRAASWVEVAYAELVSYPPPRPISVRPILIHTNLTDVAPGLGTGLEFELPIGRNIGARVSLGYWRFSGSWVGVDHVFGGLGIVWGQKGER